MMLETAEAQTMQVLVLVALALFIGVQAFPIGPVWRRRGLILGAVCLAVAVVFTVVAWYT
ncbi:hypothetical protein [Roseospira goensis]|uniref:Uncharacterized protein n=1 Tax=Roseospira goensis TaxID=391922 RepID=A0A7W6RYK6_9PROT|nr:hypothetical protein [Roseospira goensis]MBB4285620.1 hypothetical protein [Roseospira goensis]